MMTCEGYQTLIERRLHGAATADDAAALDAHVSTCTACQAFERLARGSEETLMKALAHTADSVGWDLVETVLRRARRRASWNAWGVIGLVVVGVFNAGRDLLKGDPAMAAFDLVLFALVPWVLHRLSRAATPAKLIELGHAPGSRRGLVLQARAELRGEVYRAAMGLVVLPLVALIPVLGMVSHRGPTLWGVALLAAVVGAAIYCFVTLRRRRRELVDIS